MGPSLVPDFGLDSPPSPAARRLAAAVTARLYVEFPDLVGRYGTKGRASAERDSAYLVQWALDAAKLGNAASFERNRRWLAELLTGRGFPMVVFDRTIELTREALAESGELTAAQLETIFDGTAR